MTDKQFLLAWSEASVYDDCDTYVSDVALSSIWDDDQNGEIPQERIDRLRRVWTVAHMTMHDIRLASGLTQAVFGARFAIPKRTLEAWDMGERTPPDYVRVMAAKLLGML